MSPNTSEATSLQQEELFYSALLQQRQQRQQEQQQQQRQQQTQLERPIFEDNLTAQRAVAETLEVGRATLQAVGQQREQLERTEQIADETAFTLEKANRLVRGMQWSGWMANLVTKQKSVRPECTTNTTLPSPASFVTEGMHPKCRGAAESLQTYSAHVGMLMTCQTNEQLVACEGVCQEMKKSAESQLKSLQQEANSNASIEPYLRKLHSDLRDIEKHQRQALIEGKRLLRQRQEEEKLFQQKQHKQQLQQQRQSMPVTGAMREQWDQQNAHLNFMAQSLSEIGSMSNTLTEEIHQNNHQVDTVLAKSDDMKETAQMLTRRTERMVWAKSSSIFLPSEKPTMQYKVKLQHAASRQFVAVLPNGTIGLMPIKDGTHYTTRACIFALHQKLKSNNSSSLFGLYHEQTRKWLGQSVFGSMICGASNMGRREEWEATRVDPKTGHSLGVFQPSALLDGIEGAGANATEAGTLSNPPPSQQLRLLCASAGFGAGGYLRVNANTISRAASIAMNPGSPLDPELALAIGGVGVNERERADVWILSVFSS